MSKKIIFIVLLSFTFCSCTKIECWKSHEQSEIYEIQFSGEKVIMIFEDCGIIKKQIDGVYDKKANKIIMNKDDGVQELTIAYKDKSKMSIIFLDGIVLDFIKK